MKFVEEQLLQAFKETPPETDCDVSVAVLRTIGATTEAAQRVWLSSKRRPEGARTWYLSGDRWIYGVPQQTQSSDERPIGYSVRPRPSEHRQPVSKILVKPVAKLDTNRRRS